MFYDCWIFFLLLYVFLVQSKEVAVIILNCLTQFMFVCCISLKQYKSLNAGIIMLFLIAYIKHVSFPNARLTFQPTVPMVM